MHYNGTNTILERLPVSVSISSAEVSERVAKARLMQEMYELGEKRRIQPQRLRFKINGIEE